MQALPTENGWMKHGGQILDGLDGATINMCYCCCSIDNKEERRRIHLLKHKKEEKHRRAWSWPVERCDIYLFAVYGNASLQRGEGSEQPYCTAVGTQDNRVEQNKNKRRKDGLR